MEYKVVITFDAESDLDGLLIYLLRIFSNTNLCSVRFLSKL